MLIPIFGIFQISPSESLNERNQTKLKCDINAFLKNVSLNNNNNKLVYIPEHNESSFWKRIQQENGHCTLRVLTGKRTNNYRGYQMY